MASLSLKENKVFLAAQDSLTGDIVSQSLSQWVSHFDLSVFRERCKAVVYKCDLSDIWDRDKDIGSDFVI